MPKKKSNGDVSKFLPPKTCKRRKITPKLQADTDKLEIMYHDLERLWSCAAQELQSGAFPITHSGGAKRVGEIMPGMSMYEFRKPVFAGFDCCATCLRRSKQQIEEMFIVIDELIEIAEKPE